MGGRTIGAKTIRYRSTLVRGNDRVYSASVRVPAELLNDIGAQYLRFSLKTKDLEEASFLLPFAARDISGGLESIVATRRISEIFGNDRDDYIQIGGGDEGIRERTSDELLADIREACTPSHIITYEGMYQLDDLATRKLLGTVDGFIVDFAIPLKRYSRTYWRLVARMDRLRRADLTESIRQLPLESSDPSRLNNGKRDASILETITLFEADFGRSWSPGTRTEYEQAFGYLTRLLDPQASIRSIQRSDLRRLRDMLEDLASNWHRRPQLRHLSLEEATKRSRELNLRRRSSKAIKDILDNIRIIMDFAVTEGLVEHNCAVKMHRGLPRHTSIPPHPFNLTELRQLFHHSPLYDHPRPVEKRDGLFWLPLIGLWTGMRLAECAQLRVRDISIVEGIPIIRILPEEHGEDPGGDKRVKTIHSTRVMPIHPELQRVGFVSFWRRAQIQGGERLFPEFRREGPKHGFDRASKQLTAFVRSATNGNKLVSFQSFRHTFRDAARDSGLPKDKARVLGGWGHKDMSDRYGIGGSIPRLYKDIQQIAYPGLDLSHLEL